jgi:LmbE family N-acetylglucosaminyl deacetylase
VHRLNEFDFFGPGHPELSGVNDISFHLEDELVEAKVDALRAHESQMEPLFEAYGEDFFRSILSTEVFRPGVRPGFRSRVLLDLKRA